jgi:hypothetical protein
MSHFLKLRFTKIMNHYFLFFVCFFLNKQMNVLLMIFLKSFNNKSDIVLSGIRDTVGNNIDFSSIQSPTNISKLLLDTEFVIDQA